MKKKKRALTRWLPLLVFVFAAANLVLYFICRSKHPSKTYGNADFGIADYVSVCDVDGDGVDDQTDILNSAYVYIKTEPQYKSKYYATGYPDDAYGVCTDVVAQALLGAGYDLMELVNQDILAHPQDYDIETLDKNIDFRRVKNLKVYFAHTALSLTTDPEEIAEWQGGDIVVWETHVGIISEKRGADGVPLVIHNGSPFQTQYVENVLKSGKWGDITGHYRIGAK